MASTYFTRTPASAGNRTTWTWSGWVKRSILGSVRILFSAGTSGTNDTTLYFGNSDDKLIFFNRISSSVLGYLETNQLFRDVSAWYHIVAVWNSNNATAGDRMRLYVNGSEITSFASDTNPSLNENSFINNNVAHYIGNDSSLSSSINYDGYLSQVNFIDGQALTPSSFGQTDITTGIWKPKSYSGSYGTNGFFLKFESSGSLGTDSSGNGNNFTVNGTPTQTVDTPSNVFCTLNPLSNTGVTLSNGNLTTTYSTNDGNVRSTFGMSSGKWYWEAKVLGTASGLLYGICLDTAKQTTNIADDGTVGIYGLQNAGTSFAYLDTNGTRGTSAGFPNPVANNILNFALDRDNNKFYVGINGTYYSASGATGNPATGTNQTWTLDSGYAGRTFIFILETRSSSENTNVNFGNGFFGTTAISSPFSDGAGLGKFQYQPPTGYYSLCTKNINVYG